MTRATQSDRYFQYAAKYLAMARDAKKSKSRVVTMHGDYIDRLVTNCIIKARWHNRMGIRYRKSERRGGT